MKLIEKTIKVIELSHEESKMLINLLNYCYHRATKHKSPVSQYSEQIEKFRKELEIIK
jgi:hypothetical protein